VAKRVIGMQQNCWEFKQCGREPGGSKVHEMGECPAATTSAVDGIHGGKNGGRSCWAVVGTFCDGVVQDTYTMKLHSCIGCEFRSVVEHDERGHLVQPGDIIMRIRRSA
jgi:hypothetical protein